MNQAVREASAERYVVVRICGQTVGNPQLITTEKCGRQIFVLTIDPGKQGAGEAVGFTLLAVADDCITYCFFLPLT